MAKDYIINGKKVIGWFRRGNARIPRFEDGTIARNQNISKLNNKNRYTKQELKDKYGTDNIDIINAGKEAENRVELKTENQIKAENKALENLKGKSLSQRAREIDEINKEIKDLDNQYRQGKTDNLYKLDRELLYEKKNKLEKEIDKANNRKALGKGLEDIGDKETTYYFQKEWNEGLKKSIEMEKDNYTRRKRNGDSVENLSNMNRNIQEMELQLQKEKSKEKALGKGLNEIQKNNQVKDNTLDKLFNDNKTREIKDKVSKYKKRKK